MKPTKPITMHTTTKPITMHTTTKPITMHTTTVVAFKGLLQPHGQKHFRPYFFCCEKFHDNQ